VLTNQVLPRDPAVPIAILADVRADVADVAVGAMAAGDDDRPLVLRADRQIGWKGMRNED
jgi:hypothetical protein